MILKRRTTSQIQSELEIPSGKLENALPSNDILIAVFFGRDAFV